jgi:hypothetical protein
MTARQVLQEALAVISRDHTRVQLSADLHGAKVRNPLHGTAAAWSSVGALIKVAPADAKVTAEHLAPGHLGAAWQAFLLLEEAAVQQGYANTVEVDRAGPPDDRSTSCCTARWDPARAPAPRPLPGRSCGSTRRATGVRFPRLQDRRRARHADPRGRDPEARRRRRADPPRRPRLLEGWDGAAAATIVLDTVGDVRDRLAKQFVNPRAKDTRSQWGEVAKVLKEFVARAPRRAGEPRDARARERRGHRRRPDRPARDRRRAHRGHPERDGRRRLLRRRHATRRRRRAYEAVFVEVKGRRAKDRSNGLGVHRVIDLSEWLPQFTDWPVAVVRPVPPGRDRGDTVSSNHDLRNAHIDARNEAAIRVRVLAAQEAHARDTAVRRLVGVLVQRPEPRSFHTCPVRPVTSSAGCDCDWPDPPGTTDSTGFAPGAIV